MSSTEQNSECPFCTSVPNEERLLKMGQYCYVVLSNPRLMPGHVLVIPKRHLEGRLSELTTEERAEIFEFLAEYQAKFWRKFPAAVTSARILNLMLKTVRPTSTTCIST